MHAACEYVLSHSQTETGGFAASGSEKVPPPPAGVIHCLNGNLLRALIGFGWLEDERSPACNRLGKQAPSLAKASPGITNRGPVDRDFVVLRTKSLPCAWGAIKGLIGTRTYSTRTACATRRTCYSARGGVPAQSVIQLPQRTQRGMVT